jgi:hypothetical protein
MVIKKQNPILKGVPEVSDRGRAMPYTDPSHPYRWRRLQGSLNPDDYGKSILVASFSGGFMQRRENT